jgi:rhodanese-related sulfurtransferase
MMEDITVQELKERLDSNEDLNVIDVREEYEYEEDNIGSILIPLGQVPHRIGELEKFKDQELIMLCRSGNRSGQAKMYLQQMGFSKVRNVLGGMMAYRENEMD